MPYTIQAIVAKNGTLNDTNNKLVSLNQSMEMLPLNDVFLEKHKISFLPLTDEGLKELPENLKLLCEEISKNNVVAYIEAEFFGGQGTQACVVFSNSEIKIGPIINDSAINTALNYLGVKKNQSLDEFEALGLNKHRDTNKWVT